MRQLKLDDEPTSPRDRLLRTDEVAALLGVSRRLVQRLASSNQLPPIRIGRAVRFRLRDVDRLMQHGAA